MQAAQYFGIRPLVLMEAHEDVSIIRPATVGLFPSACRVVSCCSRDLSQVLVSVIHTRGRVNVFCSRHCIFVTRLICQPFVFITRFFYPAVMCPFSVCACTRSCRISSNRTLFLLGTFVFIYVRRRWTCLYFLLLT